MKHANLLAASLIAATFTLLAIVPLTREALRFDMQMAAGRPVLSRTLTDLGVRQDNLPFNGFGPRMAANHDDGVIPSAEFSVRLASVLQMGGREKWAALQQLVAEYPDNPAGHAALARMACKNGGSVDVGHREEQEELFPKRLPAQTAPVQARYSQPTSYPEDPAIMLRSCAAGERLDPENAYFPAMAAIAHYAANQDGEARAALHRAAEKPGWREYFEVEAAGRVRRAEILHGPQNSLTESVTLASMLFPHYAGLRSMACVATVQAMHAEMAGDIDKGLALRRDVARLGEKMRDQSSSLIGGLVGIAMTNLTELRPGGASLLQTNEDDQEDSKARRARTHVQFMEYLAKHGKQGDMARWQHYADAGKETKEITRRASYVSVFGFSTMFQTQWRLMVNMLLIGAATLLGLLGSIALLRFCLGASLGRFTSAMAVITFMTLMAWGAWNALGNVRDILAFGSVIQGLSGDGTIEPALALAEKQAALRAFFIEGTLGLLALLITPVYLTVVALLAKRRGIAVNLLLMRWTLPLAALLTLGYAVHLIAFTQREHMVRAELQQVVAHEGRYVADKLGRSWPQTPKD
jgi:hypothetical protein